MFTSVLSSVETRKNRKGPNRKGAKKAKKTRRGERRNRRGERRNRRGTRRGNNNGMRR